MFLQAVKLDTRESLLARAQEEYDDAEANEALGNIKRAERHLANAVELERQAFAL